MQQACLLKTPLGEGTPLSLRHCGVSESLSMLGEATLRLVSPEADIAPDELLGKPASLAIRLHADKPRYVNGYVTRFAQGGFEGRHHVYTMTLRPWLWLLTRTSDCRIFQDLTVREIVEQVFADHPIANHEFRLFRDYRKRSYCVQYRESDYNFVARLLECEGIYWYFEHAEASHKLVLCDSASGHDPEPGFERLPFYTSAGDVPPEVDHVSEWSHTRGVKSGKVVLADYDFERPSTKLIAEQARVREYDLSDAEVFDYPGGYVEAGHGKQYAEDRLDEFHAAFETFDARSNAPGIHTGRRLKLERHPREDQNAEYLVTGTTLVLDHPAQESGDALPRFECRFEAITCDQQFRPRRRTPRPHIAGPQTAVVTGPAGEELFTDKHGRVKLHFHWDRLGPFDETSSCWVRVSQAWAGKGWGGVSIPRIGQEVIVEFLEGDPDQPLVTGRVYNAEQAPPFGMPAAAMVSGIKSKTHKGQGYNELSMDDTAGKEKITIHGQYDMDTTVLHDQSSTVKNNRTDHVLVDDDETVDNNQTQTIGVDQKIRVGGSQTIAVKVNRTETVGGAESITVIGHRHEAVNAGEDVTVTGTRSHTVKGLQTTMILLAETHTVGAGRAHTVGAAEAITVGGAQIVTIGGLQATRVGINQSTTVRAKQTTKVGADQSTDVGANRSIKVAGDQSVSVGKGRSAQVTNDDALKVGKNLVIDAGESVIIKSGSASITLKKDGTIVIKGKDVAIDGSGKVNVKADGDIAMKGSKIHAN